MNLLFLLFVSYFDCQVICRQRKRCRGMRKEIWSQVCEIFICAGTGQFQCCFALNSCKGKKKGKENPQTMGITMQKVRSMSCTEPDLTNNARTEHRTTKGLSPPEPLPHLNLGNHPRAVWVQFPPALLCRSQCISAGKGWSFREIFPSASAILWGCSERSELQFSSSRSFPTVS